MVEFCGAVGSHTFYSCIGTESISFKIGGGTLCVCVCVCCCIGVNEVKPEVLLDCQIITVIDIWWTSSAVLSEFM